MRNLNFWCQKSKMEDLTLIKNKLKYAISNLEKLKSFSKIKEEEYSQISKMIFEVKD